MSQIHITLGSNINPADNLRACLDLLREKCNVLAVSPVYETAPVGYTAQDNFLNAAVLVQTGLAPDAFRAAVIVPVELALGRTRDPHNKNAPRTIDLDIALWDHVVRTFGSKPWRVPDPDILRFSHVARPLADISPGYTHPEDGRTLAAIALALSMEGLRLRPDIDLSVAG